MKYNPFTQKLYSNDGQLLKRLHCPRQLGLSDWNAMEMGADSREKRCNHCQHMVVDTSELEEIDLRNLLSSNPDACLKVSLSQNNIRVVTIDG